MTERSEFFCLRWRSLDDRSATRKLRIVVVGGRSAPDWREAGLWEDAPFGDPEADVCRIESRYGPP
jgi:hypothetical protein